MSRNQEITSQFHAFVMAALAVTVASACIAPVSADPAGEPDRVSDAAKSGKTVVVKDKEHFCLFLPKRGQTVADSETDAKPFCNAPGLAPGANTLPHDAIISAIPKKTNDFIQMTGKLDVQKLGLRSNDGGGQYDDYTSPSTPHGSPSGAACKGFKYFVEMVEPNLNRYCIRCCQHVSHDVKDVDRACIEGHSKEGCDVIMPQ